MLGLCWGHTVFDVGLLAAVCLPVCPAALEVEKVDLLVEGTVLLALVLVAARVLNPVAEALDTTGLQA